MVLRREEAHTTVDDGSVKEDRKEKKKGSGHARSALVSCAVVCLLIKFPPDFTQTF